MKSAWMLLAFTPLLFGSPQTHPSIAPGAKETSARFLHSLLGSNTKAIVIDVRTPEEYRQGHVSEAINIPINELPRRIRKMHVPKGTTIVTMCDHGGRSSHAVLMLRKLGYKATSFCKLDSWRKDGYKVVQGPPQSPKK